MGYAITQMGHLVIARSKNYDLSVMKSHLCPFPFFLALVFLFSNLQAGALQPTEKWTNQLDSLMEKQWKAKKVQPGTGITDYEFVRRIYLDIAGRIPTAEEVRKFVADSSAAKRSTLIDELLESEGYVNHHFNLWADILRLRSNGRNAGGAYAIYLRDVLRSNKPYDKFVYELITAEGSEFETGAIGYTARDQGMPLDHMANTVRVFLGTRLECAQCHNHPFDKWTQMDFFHMAAFSYGKSNRNRPDDSDPVQAARTLINRDRKMDRQVRSNLNRALQEIRRPIPNASYVSYDSSRLPQLPHDYQYDDAEPKQKISEAVMFGSMPEITSEGERLLAYGKWMTSPDNPRFTKIIANRLWKQAMGLGLVEPVDEFMDHTQASDPELFAFLEKAMTGLDYDMKSFLRMIYHSRVYQSQSVEADSAQAAPQTVVFTGPVMRRFTAEQIWDSIVTLVNLTPDAGNSRQKAEGQIRRESITILTAALKTKTQEEILADAKKIAKLQQQHRQRLMELQKKQMEARKKKDTQRVRKLAQESGKIQQAIRTKVFQTVYKPALAKGPEKLLAQAGMQNGGSMMMMSMTGSDGKKMGMKAPQMLAQYGRIPREMQSALAKKEEERYQQEWEKLGVQKLVKLQNPNSVENPKQRQRIQANNERAIQNARRSFVGFRRNSMNGFVRAANLPSPAPGAHLLRQFGQSDRDTIENANSDAAVTQALSMLNGPVFSSIRNPYSLVNLEVKKADSSDGKVEALFLSFLGRRPDDGERALARDLVESRKDKAYEDLAFALLNNHEFLFQK